MTGAKNRKLRINKETVRALTSSEMAHVAGGAILAAVPKTSTRTRVLCQPLHGTASPRLAAVTR